MRGRSTSARSLSAALLAAVLIGWPAAVAWASGPIGYDVSYPLCGGALPAGAAFAVVGVNGGLANNANPCLPVELTWAAAAPGLSSPPLPAVSLYLNTADPGNRVADWPAPGNRGASGPTPFGGCDGSWSAACSYLYGLGRAAVSYGLAASAGFGAAATPWWLDIETVSSWAKPADLPEWAAVNVAAIQGFAAGLRRAGAGGPVGFYSTALQWTAITGLGAASSPAVFSTRPPDWVAGAGSLQQAQANCRSSFSGGPVELAQFAAGGLDADYACPPAVSARLHIVTHLVRGGVLRVSGTISRAYRGVVSVDLTASSGGQPIDLRRSGSAAHGRWVVLLRLPGRGPLRGGFVRARSSAAAGLLAGTASARVRLR